MITKKQLQKLQTLAKLSFSEKEQEGFTNKLNNVIEMIDSLSEIDCGDVQPLRSVNENYQRMREDLVITQNISAQLFANVPYKNANLAKEVQCFIVPKMVE